jgi:MtrB/PioB family decaheme-associated outer membrane protein
MLPAGFRLTGGADYDVRKRNTSDIRVVSFREETEEVTLRAELRRSISETLNGALSVAASDRGGSDWLNTVRATAPTQGSNLVHPLHLADRDRTKVKLVLDWQPLEPLSLHFVGESAKDEYSGRTLGPRSGEAQLVSLDAAYRFSDTWQGTAWVSQNDTQADQTTCESASNAGVCPNDATNPIWDASLRNVGTAVGLGLRGKVGAQLEIDGELSYAEDQGEFIQVARVGTAPVIPDVNYKTTRFRLQGRYALTKASGVRLQYVYDRFKTDDWYWTNFTYGDGTTVSQDPDQKVHFVGIGYYLRFQ